jgi:DNA mismatch repair ATPase MutS
VSSKSAACECIPVSQVLEGLQARLAGRQEALHRLGDALALLDMLQSLAHAASLAPEDYCRPSISKSGAPVRELHVRRKMAP